MKFRKLPCLTLISQDIHILLEKFSTVFEPSLPTEGAKFNPFELVLNEDTVINLPRRPLSAEKRRMTRDAVQELERMEIVRESQGPFASPIVLVPKKNGESRLCVDCRELNKITIKHRFPLPDIKILIQELSGMQFYGNWIFEMDIIKLKCAKSTFRRLLSRNPISTLNLHDCHLDFAMSRLCVR